MWVEKADQLVSAARLLKPSIISYWDKARADYMYTGSSKRESPVNFYYPFLQDVFFMLVAYALENYFKAAILGQPKHQASIASGKLPDDAKGHKLVLLASRARFELDKSKLDELFLLKLEEHSTWKGRYPAPYTHRKLVKGHTMDGVSYLTALLEPAEIPVLNDLTTRVSAYTKAIVLPRPPS